MIKLILIFVYIGTFTIGGGASGIALIQQVLFENGIVNELGLNLNQNDFFAIIAISESTSGPIGINMASFIGFFKSGLIGAFIISSFYALPSFLILSLGYNFIKRNLNKNYMKNILKYVKISIVGIIYSVIIKIAFSEIIMNLNEIKNIILNTSIFLGMYILYRKYQNPLLLILIAVLAGSIYNVIII